MTMRLWAQTSADSCASVQLFALINSFSHDPLKWLSVCAHLRLALVCIRLRLFCARLGSDCNWAQIYCGDAWLHIFALIWAHICTNTNIWTERKVICAQNSIVRKLSATSWAHHYIFCAQLRLVQVSASKRKFQQDFTLSCAQSAKWPQKSMHGSNQAQMSANEIKTKYQVMHSIHKLS